MAVSPLPGTMPSAGANGSLKPRPLTMLTSNPAGSNSLVANTQSSNINTDISEQLNEEERRRYVKGKKLGEGTYAIVYHGHHRDNPSKLVAIKKIKVNAEFRDGLSFDAIREVKYLQELSHPNIIALHSVFSSKNQNLNLVLEYLPLGDLEGVIRDTKSVHYGLADIKAWMNMLARAVWFCHESFVLHRDIKPNNLLIAADGEVKLADFGLSRSFSDPYLNMTYNVITRWYRPPELFFKARHYSGVVDVWSMGCVFAELILRTPYLPGGSDMDQVTLICKALGTPTEQIWPGVEMLDGYKAYAAISSEAVNPPPPKQQLQGLFGTIGGQGIDLLLSMLALDPNKRATSKQVLQHEWWLTNPRPSKKEALPKKGGGLEKVGEDLKRRGGEIGDGDGRGEQVARKLNFG
ncbi:kinase-like protein [Eremomyces bilateralis CBS 781.70]|uniref:Kinase-like protein n=1 Tax=Eremomyces bilateralis CBS 781.70 TaxID=1392243 RepID=A0A6G1GD12_9PEZI|nr:kinase-like protein [Eremomyces bilateralis CBS 781.70]KAF1815985.1 kinase-like protein [Eremomyces bilateralis CBS 781.70]